MKGQEAKNKVIEKIKSAFGADYLGIDTGKIYVWSSEGGEKMQVAINLTCPKVPYNGVAPIMHSDGLDFENMEMPAAAPEKPQITEDEMAKVEELMKKLGL